MNCPYCDAHCVEEINQRVEYYCKICSYYPSFTDWNNPDPHMSAEECMSVEFVYRCHFVYFYPHTQEIIIPRMNFSAHLTAFVTPANLEEIMARINNLKAFL